jgi:hypothetical protein
MKYIATILVAGAVYLMLTHHAPVHPAGNAGTPGQINGFTPGTDFLKRPLDATHAVLDQARTRAQDPALQQ